MWQIIKVFLKLWLILLVLLIVISCTLYRSEIVNIIKNNLWAFINAAMPVVLIIAAIFYTIKNALK